MTVHVLVGDDESLLRAATTEVVHRLVGDGDRSLIVEEFDGEDYELAAVVDAAQTSPFLTDRRVVLARGVGRFAKDDLQPLARYLGEPMDTTALVLTVSAARLAKPLGDLAKSSGAEVITTSAPSRPRDRSSWVADHAAEAGVKLSAASVQLLAERLGEGAGRLDGILATLSATYGSGRALTPDEVVPFVGEGGGVPPWDLTDAIDQGKTARALELLDRMVGAGGRHPLQIMAILHGHYARLARLDGVDATGEAQAAEALGIKPGFPARKALEQYRRLGGANVARAIGLLAAADLDLRGATSLDAETVMQIAVARLSRLR
ncbi:MAG: DNA polymerase III subunit delta [Desertimonas sp.]